MWSFAPHLPWRAVPGKAGAKPPRAGQTSDFYSLDGQFQDDFHCIEVSKYFSQVFA